jgi:hypothetical protein
MTAKGRLAWRGQRMHISYRNLASQPTGKPGDEHLGCEPC